MTETVKLSDDRYIELGTRFLATLDAMGDVFSLMTDDVQFEFPKWGIARGKAEAGQFFQALGGYVAALRHPPETFQYYVGDRRVVIEGRSVGRLHNGKSWEAGHFVVVYGFAGELINRVAIYLDPDYADETQDRYPWTRPAA